MTRLIASLATVLIFVVIGDRAQAMSLTFGFEGAVTEVAPELAGTFSVGQGIFGRYSFDSAQSPYPSTDPDVAIYPYETFRFRIDGYAASADDPGAHGIGVFNNVGSSSPSDIYRVQNDRSLAHPIVADPVAGYIPVEVSFQLTDLTGTALDSAALPLIPPDLADFAHVRGFRLSFVDPGHAADGPFYSVRGGITSLTAIPESATVVLMGVGLLGLGYAGRRKLTS